MTSARHSSLSLLTFISFSFLLLFDIPHAFGSVVRAHDLRRSSATDISLNSNPLALATAAKSGQGDYSCGPDKPCSNGACCGDGGWCGYGPKYCGNGCQSNYSTTAECSEFATSPGQSCPLNVCCSQYGFCGTTAEFCVTGCQSNCKQPKPSAPPSNVQKRVIGYWEAWNSQHACGTMSPGEIPVSMLTHLNVAFGYINHDFRITNMDGLSSDVYKNIGNIKSRNPHLKIIIALGGWTFTDPGIWQNVFPTMISSQANRAAFIKNLLGFLSEYGYDGVDWEYPGADDRGGSNQDGVNYTALLKELRGAINASGREYIVTFTAPTSYWYLRHFDLENMESHVDWINLMSYDLHGVWDGNNPIGNHVLSHTNLTEIDHALDLFWRVGVNPSSIVLGLGFYGRSFTLKDASCWKPGCLFSGPGAAGPCTNTAGILSYRGKKHSIFSQVPRTEITDILDRTGATAYVDKEAAARYLVYGNSSWISFDDATTIQAKIAYANKIGLAGLMVWAIDLDNNNLDTLSSISDPNAIGNRDTPFRLADLSKLFPAEDLPPAGTVPNYGIVTFGDNADSGSMYPSGSGFGFLLIAGNSHLRKREGEPEPFVFLDCPPDMKDAPLDKIHNARVICLNEDVEGCFRVMERGVEGTIVEMPDNVGRNAEIPRCAANMFARAISLEVSQDQYIPDEVEKRNPTSQVFDFSFDFNVSLMRRDTNTTSIRIDYSNAKGYWDAVVDSPGIQSRDLHKLEDRVFAPTAVDWRKLYEEANFSFSPEDALVVKEDLSAPIFWDKINQCSVHGDGYSEGFVAYVEGTLDAKMSFGFSMVVGISSPTPVMAKHVNKSMKPQATWDYGHLKVKQATGFLEVRGQTDVRYGIGGITAIDIEKANMGNPAYSDNAPVRLRGHTVDVRNRNILAFVKFNPYYQVRYLLATFNSTDLFNPQNGPAQFDGLLGTRIISDMGKFTAYFPPGDVTPNATEGLREPDKISIPSSNVLYSSPGEGGRIAVTTDVRFGLDVDFVQRNGIANYSPRIHTFTKQQPSGEGLCHKDVTAPNTKRGIIAEEAPTTVDALISHRGGIGQYMPGWSYSPGLDLDPFAYIGATGDGRNLDYTRPKIPCPTCITCGTEDPEDAGRCCGCSCMDWKYGYRDIGKCEGCNPDDEQWPGSVHLRKRQTPLHNGQVLRGKEDTNSDAEDKYHELQERVAGIATQLNKHIQVCGKQKLSLGGKYRYPAFPAPAANPWDGIENGKWDSISRYWGNSSADCSDWTVTNLRRADTRTVGPGQTFRAKYQTEHVFEGQLISDFFNLWLDKGHVKNQNPVPANPAPKMACTAIDRYIRTPKTSYPWFLGEESASFLQLMQAELGCEAHLDRLTIFLARPNRMKGSMFSGNQPTSENTYRDMDADEQLQAVKEMGEHADEALNL
ncbi:Uncharacterized protein TCAP_03313 [Tolypocladium capitatum]|uniref:chitinase n=1 Tax=Tolypocladium capitatum TaxID=45235 RepID=A0A2K3QGT9_9HYPO|nr:Uncharacterized protein TCAP_03313 [Tolypocladium capitatum]